MEKTSSKLYGLHESSVSWINELEFMNDEQNFLEHLLSTHFLDLSAEKLYETTRKLIRKLKEVENMGVELTKEIQIHNKKIAAVLEGDYNIPEKDLINGHNMIQKDFESYVLKFKYVKKKIFGIIKEIMVNHKQKLLINRT
ncbi:hypothetical protein [Lutimonas sp.]|uniref:hypothetical protein n=1 Tax=Lutimonas sp. TaxID=1872403 RepID=UPI003C7274C1